MAYTFSKQPNGKFKLVKVPKKEKDTGRDDVVIAAMDSHMKQLKKGLDKDGDRD